MNAISSNENVADLSRAILEIEQDAAIYLHGVIKEPFVEVSCYCSLLKMERESGLKLHTMERNISDYSNGRCVSRISFH